MAATVGRAGEAWEGVAAAKGFVGTFIRDMRSSKSSERALTAPVKDRVDHYKKRTSR